MYVILKMYTKQRVHCLVSFFSKFVWYIFVSEFGPNNSVCLWCVMAWLWNVWQLYPFLLLSVRFNCEKKNTLKGRNSFFGSFFFIYLIKKFYTLNDIWCFIEKVYKLYIGVIPRKCQPGFGDSFWQLTILGVVSPARRHRSKAHRPLLVPLGRQTRCTAWHLCLELPHYSI